MVNAVQREAGHGALWYCSWVTRLGAFGWGTSAKAAARLCVCVVE